MIKFVQTYAKTIEELWFYDGRIVHVLNLTLDFAGLCRLPRREPIPSSPRGSGSTPLHRSHLSTGEERNVPLRPANRARGHDLGGQGRGQQRTANASHSNQLCQIQVSEN